MNLVRANSGAVCSEEQRAWPPNELAQSTQREYELAELPGLGQTLGNFPPCRISCEHREKGPERVGLSHNGRAGSYSARIAAANPLRAPREKPLGRLPDLVQIERTPSPKELCKRRLEEAESVRVVC